jgi:hypothetical protein
MPVRGINKHTVFTAQSVASGGGTATSSAFAGIAAGKDMSLFLTVTGANGDVKAEVLTSHDATTFTVPETGSTVILGVTDQVQRHASLSIPLCSQFKIKLTNDGAGTVTVTVVVLSQ